MGIHYGHSLDLPEPLERWVLLLEEARTVKLSETEDAESLHRCVHLCEYFIRLRPNCV